MESTRIYEESLKELNNIKNQISNKNATIIFDFSKLDSESRGVIKTAMSDLMIKRGEMKNYKQLSTSNRITMILSLYPEEFVNEFLTEIRSKVVSRISAVGSVVYGAHC